jgi:cell wall-associated NlpC family hydrolase
MTTRKTQSLTLASDAVARLREMHELDNRAGSSLAPLTSPNGSSVATQQPDNVATVERSSAATTLPGQRHAQERENAATQHHDSAKTKEQAHTPAQKRGSGATGARRNDEAQQSENLVYEAMRQVLRAPYSDDLSKGPATASTIRIPTEIWGRLDMAARLQQMTKQDIIADALVKHLSKIGRGEG